MALEWILALALLALVLLLLVALLLRRPRVALPPEWLERLQALEAAAQGTQLVVARNDGALSAMREQLHAFSEATRGLLDERLAQAREEARASRGELQAAFSALQSHLEQLLAQARGEQTQALAAFRSELSATVQQLVSDSAQSREGVAASTEAMAQRIQQRFDALAEVLRGSFDSLKGDLHGQLGASSATLKEQLGSTTQELTRQLSGLVASHQQGGEALRNALNERLAAIQGDNAMRLEEMRRTVDEKLHATLERRLGESFKLVSERLEQVHKGLGEMQTLAGSVGDLKRVMTNVKARGTWGELQLAAIIDNVLTAEQYARNVKTVPGSDELVEFAIRLPGRGQDTPVWLPVDSKYPVEHYQRLLDAQDAADKAAIAAAGNAFETSIRFEARKISAKYVAPPHTTDFAILYLSTEGLFAEVMRRPGLVEAVQNELRVMITGPANFAAMLSSLQMGFKTLAIEQRSAEVWSVLGQVKTEFAKFGDAVEATRKSIDAAARKFEQVDVRTRAIQRRLRSVQELPAPPSPEPRLPDMDDEPA
ncbi:DNA recombination protein RmuC [Comamonas sp. NLF-1-9]|uniref:DNA recombination protein RmuC n=1 Tax=Comamonas sp. NLF-1-9 TaxID=2853163 RepID=UPI001C447CF7|nr:DNA recombination protein RmuC [Comamonas sp. NLF-1-9]QXL84600.1 DNA recombination protein RmuC [Comamonas sp. NLF-1-9]